MSFKIFAIAIMGIIVLLILYKLRSFFRPAYSQVQNNIQVKYTQILKSKIEYRFFRIKNKFYNSLKKMIVLTKAQEREYIRYIERLNLKWDQETLDPRILKLQQFIFMFAWFIIALLGLSFSKLLGIMLLILLPMGYMVPIIDIKDKIAKLDGAIIREFSTFYSLVYYQFRKQNKMLSSVVREYLPNATDVMAFELKIFLHNLSKGEEYALMELRKRLPLKYIIRFCDVMKVRVTGIENISQMEYLKEEMHEEERYRIKRILEKRKLQAKYLQTVVYLLLVQFVIVYWYLQLNSARSVIIH